MRVDMVGNRAAAVVTNFGEIIGANPAAQVARLRGDPLMAIHVAWQTLALHWLDYLVEFVGQLGWLDTTLPAVYHQTSRAMLGVAALAAVLGMEGERILTHPLISVGHKTIGRP